jgi:dTDP-4-dehydrorhamnose reductase
MSALKDDYEVVGIDRYVLEGQNGLAIDITRRERILESITTVAPNVVVHTAAETNVDRCETQRDVARRINVEGTANIAQACARVRATYKIGRLAQNLQHLLSEIYVDNLGFAVLS